MKTDIKKLAETATRDDSIAILRWLGFKIKNDSATLWYGETDMDHNVLCGSIDVRIALTPKLNLRKIWSKIKDQICELNRGLCNDELIEQSNRFTSRNQAGVHHRITKGQLVSTEAVMTTRTPLTTDALRGYISYCEEQRLEAQKLLTEMEGEEKK